MKRKQQTDIEATLQKIYTEFTNESIMKNAASHIAFNYHSSLARKVTNYYKLLFKSSKVHSIVFGQDPYKNDYCSEIGSAFSYNTRLKPPFSCKVLAKYLHLYSNDLSEREYLNSLSTNYELAEHGVFFLDMLPYPAVKTLVSKRDAKSLNELEEVKVKYSKKLNALLEKFILNLDVKNDIHVYLFGKNTQKLFYRTFGKWTKSKQFKLVYHNSYHPAYERWKKGCLDKNTMIALATLLKRFTVKKEVEKEAVKVKTEVKKLVQTKKEKEVRTEPKAKIKGVLKIFEDLKIKQPIKQQS